MKLVPINSDNKTKLFTTKTEKIEKKELKKSSNNDPLSIIPGRMYSIISSHRKDIIASIFFISFALCAATVLVITFATIMHTGWFAYVIPVLFAILLGYKLIIMLIEYNAFNKWVQRYREDIQYDLTSVPQFLDTIYIGLIKKQVAHNWISFISLFYIGIFTILLWWLKDQSWWIFKFNIWIENIFKDPTLITTLLTISILLISAFHIYSAIRRKQQLYRIDAFLGHRIISGVESTEMKATLNKGWRRAFILSLLILFVIPIILKLILKLWSKR